ncbi:nasonin-4 precursor [Nasonia vitripennis]|uniref:Uncharacterized protein n=2 Tax=Nasonia vitripennis TaxID=7425 RepID=A0A7M6W5U2_NASVI|nr:nasonin-4 precursor [Nasonia vitripennis]
MKTLAFLLLLMLLAHVASSESAYCGRLDCWHDCIFKFYRYGVCVGSECQCRGKIGGGK